MSERLRDAHFYAAKHHTQNDRFFGYWYIKSPMSNHCQRCRQDLFQRGENICFFQRGGGKPQKIPQKSLKITKFYDKDPQRHTFRNPLGGKCPHCHPLETSLTVAADFNADFNEFIKLHFFYCVGVGSVACYNFTKNLFKTPYYSKCLKNALVRVVDTPELSGLNCTYFRHI